MSKKQATWLKKTAKKTNMSVSKLCKWLMDKNIAKICSFLTEEEFKELIRIARTPWIRLDDDNE